MSTERDVERIVRSWMDEGVDALPDRVLDAVLDQIPATPQRRAGWLARRLTPMNTIALRLGIAAVVVSLAIILGINYLPGLNIGGPPEASPSPTPEALAVPGQGASLAAGTYVLRSFPGSFTVTVPEGWVNCSPNELEQGVCYQLSADNAMGVGFLVVNNVVSDPCTDHLMDPPVGPSVDDLVTAISNLQGFDVTAPLDLLVDGFSGKQFTVTAPTNAGCDLRVWATAFRINGVGAGEVNLVRILDIDGTRVLISGAYHPSTASEADITALQQVFASVHISP
jgi:hypothetical protein